MLKSPAAALALLAPLLLAAVNAQEPPLIDVASVKRHPPDDNTQWMIAPQPGGRLRLRLTPERLVSVAFRVQMDQVIGAPSWAKSDTYDILLKVRDGAAINIDTIGPLARELAVDRFHLKTRMDTRELPVYLLVRGRSDGPLGAHLTPAQLDCTLRDGAPPPRSASEPAPAAASRCGLTQRGGAITMGGFPLAAFTRVLSSAVGRVVIDRTGLTGNWDLDLEYTPDQGTTDVTGPPARDAPTLFTAIQEQLGLKLESGRAPVTVVVIDGLSRPSED